MQESAGLVIKVDGRQIAIGKQQLEDLAKAGGKAEKASRDLSTASGTLTSSQKALAAAAAQTDRELADLYRTEVQVATGTRRLGDASRATAGDVDTLYSSYDRMGGLLGKVMGAVSAAGLIFAARQGADVALKFAAAMDEVSTLVDGAAFSMDALSEAATRQAGAFNSQPIAQSKALYQIISAGASSSADAIETLTAANKLAVGGVTDVAIAADGLTSILNAYGDRVSGAADVSDAMFVAMRAGKTTIAELSSSLGMVAPLAAATGVSFDELAASVAALTKGGISTNVAVTGVRAVLAAVAKPAAEATKLSKELGLEFSAAALEAKGLSAFLADLVDKTGGNTESLAKLFGGVEALVPVMALAGKAGEDFNAILDDMAVKTGATDEAFEKIAAGAAFQVGLIFSTLQARGVELATDLLTVVSPAIKVTADLITGAERPTLALQIALNTLGLSAAVIATKSLYGLAASVVASTISAVSGSAAWIAYSAAVARVGMVSATATAATTALGVAVRFALGPVGLMITAVGLVATGMALSSRETAQQEARVRDAASAMDAYEQAAMAAAIATGESAIKSRENADAMRQEALAAITAAKALREKELAALKVAEARQRDPFLAQRNTNPLGNPEADPLVVQSRERLARATAEASKLEARYADILSGKSLPVLPKVAAATNTLATATERAGAATRQAAREFDAFERELARVLEQLMTPAERALRDMHANMAILREAYDRGLISVEQYREGVNRAWLGSPKLVKAVTAELITLSDEAKRLPSAWENALAAIEEVEAATRSIRWGFDDIARSIEERDWASVFGGLMRTLKEVQTLWNSGQPGGRSSAAGAVLSSVGGAVGGSAGGVISGIGSGFSAAGAAAGMAGMGAMGASIAAMAGPIGIAVAGFSILSKVLSDGAAKRRAKVEAEANDIQRAAAIAKERENTRARLEIELLRASGDELAAVTRERENELKALDSVSAAIQRQIYTLQDWSRSVTEAESAVAAAEADLRRAYDTERDRLLGIIGGVDEARQALIQAHGREKAAIEATMNGIEGLISGLRTFRQELDLNPLAQGTLAQGRDAALTQFQAAGAADAPQAGRAFLDASLASARTMAEFQRDRAMVARAIDGMTATAEVQLTDAQRQLAALDRQVAGLIAANDNLLSVEAAIRNLETAEQAASVASAQLAALDAQVGALINLNSSFMSVAQAIGALASAQEALAAAQAARPDTASAGAAAFEIVGAAGYVDRNPDLAALFASGTGMARGRSKEEFGLYHFQRYGQAEDRFFRPFADGGMFSGGMVSGPTAFPMGMMGEAGPEAIMPLANVGGRLGVVAANDGLKDEVRALRQEMAAMRLASERTAKASEDSRDVLEGAARGQLSITTEAA